jgi:hypothetical protein
MFVILLENGSNELVFGVMNSLDDEPIIAREVKERPRLARRS